MTNLIIKYFPKVNITCYSGLFLNYIACHIMMTISALFLYRGLSFKDENHQQQTLEEKKESKKSFRKIFGKSLIQFEVLFVYVLSAVGGALLGAYQSFLFLHLKEIGSTQTVMTLSISIAAAAGIFGYFFSAKIIRFFGGPLRSIFVSLIFFGARCLGYALSPNGWILLIFQPLHILSYALFLTSGIQYMKETSPLIVITSMVSLFQTMFEGVGVLVGSSIGGVIFKNYGGRKLYLIFAFFALFWTMILGVYVFMIKKKRDNKTKEDNN
eukprot:TCONS_00071479-protein